MSDRVLYALKATGPRTAAELAERLEITPVAVRQHLDRLLDEGVVAYEDRRETVGRPKRHWHLTEAGHARFPDSHAGLTAELLKSTAEVFGEEGLDRLIANREARTLQTYRRSLEKADSLPKKVAKLAALREAEGYMAEWRRNEDGSFLLVENHCPICVAARQCQSLCRSELAVFSAVLGPEARVERIDHILAGARRCAYRITPAEAG